MVGSIGRLGVIVQLSLKVFPRPQATTTAEFVLGDTRSALAAAGVPRSRPRRARRARLRSRTGSCSFVSAAIPTCWLRARTGSLTRSTFQSGTRGTRGAGTLARGRRAVGGRSATRSSGSVSRRAGPWSSLGARRLRGVQAHYAIACTTGWIACPIDRIDALDAMLTSLRMPGVVLRRTGDRPLLGPPTGGAFGTSVTTAIDPRYRFLELERWIVSRL